MPWRGSEAPGWTVWTRGCWSCWKGRWRPSNERGEPKGTRVRAKSRHRTRRFRSGTRRGKRTLFFMAARVKISSLSSLGMFSRNCRTCFFLLRVPTRADMTPGSATATPQFGTFGCDDEWRGNGCTEQTDPGLASIQVSGFNRKKNDRILQMQSLL